MIERLLGKSAQALTTATHDLDEGDRDAAANRCSYAVYYAAWALFVTHRLGKPKTHTGLIGEFAKRFVKHGPFDRELGAIPGKHFFIDRAFAPGSSESFPTLKSWSVEIRGGVLLDF